MPGILGIISSTQPPALASLARTMATTMRHRPEMVTGTEQFDRFRAVAGWTCHPGSFADCMPAWNDRRDICLIFTGEHFPSNSVAESTGEPVAALVGRYERLGDGFFQTLNGAFAGLLVDCRPGRERLVLFNDRYGLSRIYYYQSADGFYFASEAKALLKVLPELRELSLKGLAELFGCGCVMQNRTLFPKITLLPGGSLWSFAAPGRVDKLRYFDPATWERQPALSLKDYGDRMAAALVRIIPRYFSGPQEIGMSLTGGVDSRMVMAAVGALPKFRCYTFGGMYRECADVRVARRISQVLGHPYEEIALSPREFFPAFPQLARETVYRTDGTVEVSAAVGLFVNGLARQIAPIRMTGNYGGEILRGLLRLKPTAQLGPMFGPDFCPLVREAAETCRVERQAPLASVIAFKQVPWLHYGRFALEQSQLTIRTPFLDNELVELSYAAPPEAQIDKAPAFDFIRNQSPVLSRVPTDRGLTARFTWLPVRQRRMLTEFMPRVEYVYDYGMPQWMTTFDRWTAPLHLERLFLGRQKYTHYRTWYRRELSKYVLEILLDPGTLARPYLNRVIVEKMARDHVTGHGNYTTEIHRLLTTEMIERHLVRES